MRTIILLTALLLAPSALASQSALNYRTVQAAIEIETRADHVVVPIAIIADIRNPVERLEAIGATIRALKSAFSARRGVEIEVGPVTLTSRYPSKVSSSSGGSSANLFLLSPLTDDGDVFSMTKTAYQAIGIVRSPEDVRILVGDASLTVKDPETYRAQLLKSLRSQLDLVKDTLGETRSVNIKGLDTPVRVSQKSDTEVVLYLEYSYDIEM